MATGMSRWLGVAAASMLVPLATLTLSAGTASAAPGSGSGLARAVVTMFSDSGDYIGGGTSQEFDTTNSSVSGTASTTGFSLSVSGGTLGSDFTFVIDPPPGKAFGIGYYPGAQRAEFRTAGHPGLDIFGNGRGCNQVTGAFEVRDLAVSGSTIKRLDLLYEQHCEGGPQALFGQVRFGEPAPQAGLIVSSSSITWPATSRHAVGTPVPVYIRNTSSAPVTIGTSSVSGYSAAEFSIKNDTCSGQTLPPAGACDLWVTFRATQRGPRSASLTLPIGSTANAIQLDAPVSPGTTELVMQSQPGDFVGGGLNYDFTSANAVFNFSATPSGLEMNLTATDGEYWTVDMFPGQGQILAPGKYPNATRYPFNGSGNGLSVTGDSRGCNTLTGSFTIKQVVFSPVDSSLLHFDGTFIQHCEGGTPALTGELKYDSAPVVAPPPGVSNLSAQVSGSNASVTWTNPSSTIYRYTVVRIEKRRPVATAPFAGTAVYAGTGTSAVASGLGTGSLYTITAYTVDQYGNVSYPANLTIRG